MSYGLVLLERICDVIKAFEDAGYLRDENEQASANFWIAKAITIVAAEPVTKENLKRALEFIYCAATAPNSKKKHWEILGQIIDSLVNSSMIFEAFDADLGALPIESLSLEELETYPNVNTNYLQRAHLIDEAAIILGDPTVCLISSLALKFKRAIETIES